MSNRLQGKVAIVTGAASGIGAETAARLAAEGAAVVVADINLPGAEQQVARIVQTGAAAAAVRVDLGDEQSINQMISFAVERKRNHLVDGLLVTEVNPHSGCGGPRLDDSSHLLFGTG